MEMNPAVAAAPDHYQAVFRGHFVRRTQMLLTQFNRSEPPPSEVVKQAFQALTCAGHVVESWPHTRSLLLTLAPKLEQAGYRDEWLAYLEQGLRQSQWLGDLAAAAELHLQAGILHQLRTNYPAARTHLELSAGAFAQLQAPADQARALNRLAYVARLQRRFEEAIRLVEQAQSLLSENDTEMAFADFVQGLVALDQRKWSEAERYAGLAFNRWATVSDHRMMGRSLMCRGVALEKMDLFQESIRVAEQAITLFKAIDDQVFLAAVQMNLGNVYVALGEPEESLALYLPAKKLFQRIQDRYSLALVTHNLGRAYCQLHRWQEAENAFFESIHYKSQLGYSMSMVNSIDGLAEVYLGQNRIIEARKILLEALAELSNLQGDAGYEERLEMINGHLHEINRRLPPKL